ncbi:tumor necrosis factor receptor superfamily member 13B [Siniperca chuatsi]|uniref:tumor necrosis factor receptor superfamily member 13B n=1 Tax=Siniperca chuatsi TaxID=119488 RepID=UPI001CE05015|nr:tumor necrosis factor receptor superfamily member 13B [Siniperca chuatsi]XP_044035304.1 tumor necrosis factor receptor superfamily member 13B [Siniperca chuatsi]
MGGSCHDDQYWDALVKECLYCHKACQQSHVNTRCTSYCESANCKALPGHYYDGLLKKCMRCAEVCGRHPAECSQHCKVTSHVPKLSVPTALEESTILHYSLLALCMVLLFSSLSLALAVFLRKPRAKTSNPGPKEAYHNQDCVVQLGQEVGQPGGQQGQSSTDFVTNSSRLTDREPSDDSSPTETCVCVHCFPDLKALGQGNDRLLRAPFSYYPQAVHHRAQIQKGGPLWTEENLHTSGLEVQEEVAVG